MKKHRIILGIVAAVVVLPPLVIITIICIYMSSNSAVEFDEYYGYIEDIFESCDTDDRFTVTGAKCFGYYAYDLDVDLRDISSEQELFDEVASFVCRINEQVMSNKESELFSQGYYFGINEYILGKQCLLAIWVDPYPDGEIFTCDTNIYADYSALNPIAGDLPNSCMHLEYDDFTEAQIETIQDKQDNYLFEIVF